MDRTKIGVFGGTFNPLHVGHIGSMKTVKEKLGLEKIRVVPASQSPNRKKIDGPTPDQRLEMVHVGLVDYQDTCEVDDREVVRGGISYTIDTLVSYTEDYPDEEIYLIIGLDQFEQFDQWNRFEEILEISNLVVTSRPGGKLPKAIDEFPPGVASFVSEYNENFALLRTGKTIQFIQLNDIDISATELRKKIRNGDAVDDYIPLPVRSYIQKHELYESLGKVIGDFERFTHQCANYLFAKNGINVQAYDLRELNQPSEFSIIASGTSTRHTSALADHVVRQVKKVYGVYPQNIEGIKEGRWVVLDYGSLMIHLFYDYVRIEYQLEKLWEEGVNLHVKGPNLNRQTS
ncbi:MAG: nicotinate (nicotinamide) nucleotide adenylyltransferase [Bdellovibrionales bacterium]|nr:nicotinate (nicotinamide) nucleotide adenylyltransferase [Bdellovibrionales bacterium]